MAAAISPTGAASDRAATIGPTSFTVISFSKNSLSSSDVKPIRTGRGWFWRRVVVDHERHLVGRVAVAGGGVAERALGHRRDEHLVADARRLDDDAILELAPQPPADSDGDHPSRLATGAPADSAR